MGISYQNNITKRLFDIFFSLFFLLISAWLILIAWIIACVEVKENGFFIQQRVGMNGKLFNIIKIKTMRVVTGIDSTITSAGDIRITKIGAFFRKTKIDELPQLWNILIGQMSFVGPRPDVPGYADKLHGKDKIILSIRPGVTGPAQLVYKNEEAVLAIQSNPVKYNNEVIWPNKVKINQEYIENYSFFKDVYYIWKTIVGGNFER